MSPDIETVKEVEFFNITGPGDSIFIAPDPDYDKLANKALAKEKWAHFRAGLFSTSDPEIIKALNSQALRAKGVRCMQNAEDLAEYGSNEDRKSWMEQEIERRVAEELETRTAQQAHAEASPFEVSEAQAAESVEPQE